MKENLYNAFLITLYLMYFHPSNAQHWDWGTGIYEGSSSTYIADMAADRLGNCIVVGAYTQHWTLVDGTWLNSLAGTTALEATIVKFDQSGNYLWHVGWASATNTDNSVRDVQVDPHNNLIVGGYGGNIVTDSIFANIETGSITKLDPLGNILWTQPCPGLPHLFAGPDGTIYFAFVWYWHTDGFLCDTFLDFTTSFTYVVYGALDEHGALLWHEIVRVTSWGGAVPISTRNIVKGIRVHNNRLLIFGDFSRSLLIGNYDYWTNSPTDAHTYLLVANANDGRIIHIEVEDSSHYETTITDVAFNHSGNLHVSLQHTQATSIFGLSIPPPLDNHSVLLQVDTNYNGLWWTHVGLLDSVFSSEITIASVGTDSDGNTYGFGSYQGNDVSIGGISLNGNGNYVSRYNPSGQLDWAFPYDAQSSTDMEILDDQLYILGTGHEPFGLDTIFPSTYANHFGKLNIFGNVISGRAYYDMDTNGNYTAGDVPIPNSSISIQPSSNLFFTRPNGEFTLFVNSGSYNLSIDHIPDYYTPDPNHIPITFNDHGNTLSGQDLRIQPFPGGRDVEIRLIATSPMRPGFDATQLIKATNLGTTFRSGDIQLTISDSIDLLSTTPTMTPSGNFHTLSYDSLAPGNSLTILVDYHIPANLALGSLVRTECFVTPISDDTIPQNNIDSLLQIVSGSYDPNDKMVHPPGDFPEEEQWGIPELEYTIRFQNTGSDTAFKVTIIDSLSEFLEHATFQLLESSHSVQIEYHAGSMFFHYNDILLPDSSTNEPASHGYVHYSIDLQDSLLGNTKIKNRAFIYFDYNVPIITNTTVNCIIAAPDTSVVTVYHQPIGSINVCPNPTNGLIRVTTDKSYHQAHLYDINGILVYSTQIDGTKWYLDLHGYQPGLYFLKLISNKLDNCIKVVLE